MTSDTPAIFGDGSVAHKRRQNEYDGVCEQKPDEMLRRAFCFCATTAIASLIFGFIIRKKLGLDKGRLAAPGCA